MAVTMKIKKLYNDAVIPTRADKDSAGLDLYAHIIGKEELIHPHETKLISVGFSMELPHGYYGAIHPRSGLSVKEGLRLANCCGIIDSSYRGEVKVALYNDSDMTRVISKDERIAQMIIEEYPDVFVVEADELSETERGKGSFGHSGK